MNDPLNPFSSWRRHYPQNQNLETEILDLQDRVAFAVALIRDHELATWFERNETLARQIAVICPQCAVFTIPAAALLIDNLHRPPAWCLRSRSRN